MRDRGTKNTADHETLTLAEQFVLVVIGGQGISIAKDITQAVMEEFLELAHDDLDVIKESAVRPALNKLVDRGLVKKEKVTTFTTSFYIYYLTRTGKATYNDAYHCDPVTSDAEQLMQRFGSPSHGYSVLEVMDRIEKSHSCDDVSSFQGVQVPFDIICWNGSDFMYINVLIGATLPENRILDMFNDNLDEMNFVVQNKDAVEAVSNRIREWSNDHEQKAVFRVTTGLHTERDLWDDYSWDAVFRPEDHAKSAESLTDKDEQAQADAKEQSQKNDNAQRTDDPSIQYAKDGINSEDLLILYLDNGNTCIIETQNISHVRLPGGLMIKL